MTSYVFVTGGVVSSLGKGITSACLGAILESRGLSISMIKLDPYINVDPGTMSPISARRGFRYRGRHGGGSRSGSLRAFRQHDDGAQQQFYDRPYIRNSHSQGSGAASTLAQPFKSFRISPMRSRTASNWARVMRTFAWSKLAARWAISSRCRFSKPSARWVSNSGNDRVVYVHLTLVPYIATSSEIKTKPTQHSVERTPIDRHTTGHTGMQVRTGITCGTPPQNRAVYQRAGEGGDLGHGCGRSVQDSRTDAGAGTGPDRCRPIAAGVAAGRPECLGSPSSRPSGTRKERSISPWSANTSTCATRTFP